MENTNQFGLSSIGQIAITVHDVDASTAFYRDKLGLKHLFSVSGMSFFDCGGVRLMMTKPEKPEFDHPSSIFYFKVSDIELAYKTLADRGVKFDGKPHLIAKMPDHDLWMAFFRDLENNLLALMSEVAH